MKLVGFGCSFTYGSELLDPDLDNWDRHHENSPYRERHVWLGELAQQLDYEYDNYAQPSCSNYAIGQIFNDWFTVRDPQEDILVCVAWTATDRMSWWDNEWVHDGFIRYDREKRYKPSFKDWLNYPSRNKENTDQAKLFVNTVCNQYNIDIVQFDALPNNNLRNYNNFHMQGTSMRDCLETEGKRLEKSFFAPGGHPNELGHKYYVKLMLEWMRGKKIV